MKKTTTINLNGLLFHIDEDGFDRLSFYLAELRTQLVAEEGVDEILEDIEARIAELFSERLRYGLQVVTFSDVEEVIGVLGSPEEFEEDRKVSDASQGLPSDEADLHREQISEEEKLTDTEQEGSPKGEKRLFRDTRKGYIGGVAAGLATYLNVQVVWVRLFFVLAVWFYGATIFLYLLFWLIVPAARTTAQRLQMKGEAVNIDNITRTVKEEQESSCQQEQPLQGSNRIWRVLGGILLGLLCLVLGVPLAVILVLMGLVVCAAIFVFFSGAQLTNFFFRLGEVPDFPFGYWPSFEGNVLQYLGEGLYLPLFSVAFLVGIPAFALLRTLLASSFGWRAMAGWVKWLLTLGWVAALVTAIYWVSAVLNSAVAGGNYLLP